jgi:putative ABC transport system permease protein
MHRGDAIEVINMRMTEPPIRDEANLILVEVKSSTRQDEAIQSVKHACPDLVVSTYACYRPAAAVMGINEGAAWLLTAILGTSAVALALKSQLSSVIERRREIGILKSIGLTNGNILAQILAESVLQAVAGGVIGCLLAAAVLMLAPIKALGGIATPVAVSLSPWVMTGGVVLAILGGIIAGVFPALSAARQQPADALRSI